MSGSSSSSSSSLRPGAVPAHGRARPAPGRHAGPSAKSATRTPTNHAEPVLWPAPHPCPPSPCPRLCPAERTRPRRSDKTPDPAQCARPAKEGGEGRPRCTHALVVPPHVAALFIRGQVPVPAHELVEELGGRYHRELRAESPSPDTNSAASPAPPAPRLTETKWRRRRLALPTMHRAGRARRAPLPHGASAPPSPGSRGPGRRIPVNTGMGKRLRLAPREGQRVPHTRGDGKPCPARRAVVTDNVRLPVVTVQTVTCHDRQCLGQCGVTAQPHSAGGLAGYGWRLRTRVWAQLKQCHGPLCILAGQSHPNRSGCTATESRSFVPPAGHISLGIKGIVGSLWLEKASKIIQSNHHHTH